MKLIKVSELLLVFCWVLWVSADGLHEALHFSACSDSNGENMDSLDGAELWYADFINRRLVDALPDFADPITSPGAYERAVAEQQVCRQNLKTVQSDMSPEMKIFVPVHFIYIRDNMELGVKNTLICYVSGFYPAPVKVSWTKNGENVTEGASIKDPSPKKDGSFTQISTLEFIPHHGDVYSCSVEHLALSQPLARMWDVETTQPCVGPAVFCGLGLTFGLLGVATRTFFLFKGIRCR
ncbi:H-2 class II histocompatibility antigen, A-D alpha chain-like [Stegastes partitus]|uniref:H-2 class II histocompatibility antigen, A-D alpha chain-like n=1 Tax=Stegastes partitus TaxID=144197 RepID=A0A9Y4KER9_9TELE|nr:PREDICTED: H-2 class II histocompatibility antigen, A-D alpha chain-like [Stegastes partitus]